MATIKLTQKITVLGAETDTIELRQPTTRDVRKNGMPFSIKVGGGVDIDMDVCAKYIASLSNLTDGDVDKMSPDDFINVAMTVVTFFNPAMPETPAAASQS